MSFVNKMLLESNAIKRQPSRMYVQVANCIWRIARIVLGQFQHNSTHVIKLDAGMK